jgi:thiamine pyrophosphokinase
VTRVAIVLAGGDPVDSGVASRLPAGVLVVAADSGVHLAEPLGLHVDHIVGDFDSAKPDVVDDAIARGATVTRHPVDKDATDLELALAAAQSLGAERVTVVGGAGGRLDHYLANIMLLASPRFAALELEAWFADAYVTVARGGEPPRVLAGERGALVTLLPVGGDAHAVTTQGLKYPLAGEDLPAGTTRGVSNVFSDETASVVLAEGTVLIVQPFGGTT